MRTKVLFLLMSCCLSIGAQSLRTCWIEMPDSMAPYLNRNLRTELVDFADMGVRAEVKNIFGGVTTLDTLTANYLKVILSSRSDLQLKLLPNEGGDSVLCMVRTYYGPVAESTVGVYTLDWRLIHEQSFSMDDFFTVPDTMSAEAFQELRSQITSAYISANLSEQTDELILSMDFPLFSAEERNRIVPLLKLRKLNWKSLSFK